MEELAVEEVSAESPVMDEAAVDEPVVKESVEDVLDRLIGTPSVKGDVHDTPGGFLEVTSKDDLVDETPETIDLSEPHPGEIEALPVGHESLDNPPILGDSFLVREIEYPMLWVDPGQVVVNVPWTGEAVDVPVARGFWLGERLVTQSEYQRIVGRHTNYFWESTEFPVEQVSWLDCIEFCKALTALERRERRLPAGYEYRLPLEIEWEYACRAESTSTYFFGDDPEEIEEFAWVRRNSDRRTHEVAEKKPNPWGFYDMYGNVREWVHDSYFISINENFAGEIPDEFRISRGGGYMSRDKDCESTSRETNSLFHRFRNLGFRFALSEVEEDSPEK
ncbi:MAG: formylglycine-generating enzyme family protein [Opitutales bacterium]